jgi:hypothetical protein
MDPGAYGDDMAGFLRLSDEDVERLFRGLAPEGDEDLRDLASFLVDATESLSRSPRSEVTARHLARLAEAVGSAESQGSPQPHATKTGGSLARSAERRGFMRHRTVRWAAKVAVGAASLVVMTAALALAGVDLPGTAAETAFESVGVDLPNQGQGAADAVDPAKLPSEASETAARVLTVIQEWQAGASWTGCEFGARVSHAARGLEGEPDTSRCGAAGSESGERRSEGAGSRGDDGSEGPGAAANADVGLDTADQASDGKVGGAAGTNGS